MRAALIIAAVEGLLVLMGAIPWWLVFALAGASVALYLWLGRESRSDAVRQASWIAAASQLLVALVPVMMVVLGAIAIMLLALFAILALTLLVLDRR
jgi:hypothetical protein